MKYESKENLGTRVSELLTWGHTNSLWNPEIVSSESGHVIEILSADYISRPCWEKIQTAANKICVYKLEWRELEDGFIEIHQFYFSDSKIAEEWALKVRSSACDKRKNKRRRIRNEITGESGKQRKGSVCSKAKLIEWMDSWYDYGFLEDFHIEEIEIKIQDIIADDSWNEAQAGKQTPLHAYLKWQIYRWMSDHDVQTRYEGHMYVVNPDLLKYHEKIIVGGKLYRPTSKIIDKGSIEYFDLKIGFLIRSDLISNTVSAEIGFTTPSSLLSPLIAGILEKTYWVPFPQKINEKSFNPSDNDLNSLIIYEIS